MEQIGRPFKTILFGFAFSPSLEVNILETSRIAHFFNAKLILLHVGEKSEEKVQKINDFLDKRTLKNQDVEVLWENGDPYTVISENCKKIGVDLLILGALQHENLYKFYVGSIARKLTRKVCCSVLLLIKPSAVRVPCQHVVVNGLEDEDTPLAIANAFYVATAFGSKQLTIVEEIRQTELTVVEDDETLKKATLLREKLSTREDARIKKILKSIPKEHSENIKVNSQPIFGKRGYSIGHYAEVVRADLLVMNAPKKTGLLDRIFPHDIEYILSDLPTDLLIIRDKN